MTLFFEDVKISMGGDKQQIQKFMEVLSEMALPLVLSVTETLVLRPRTNFLNFRFASAEKEIFNSAPFQTMMKEDSMSLFRPARELADKNHHECFLNWPDKSIRLQCFGSNFGERIFKVVPEEKDKHW